MGSLIETEQDVMSIGIENPYLIIVVDIDSWLLPFMSGRE